MDEYDHGPGGGVSVIGGYVYRGAAIPGLSGYYLYSDLNSQGSDPLMRAFVWDGAAGRCNDTTYNLDSQLAAIEGDISSFGEDALGELYVTSMSGFVYRIVAQ